MAKLQVIGNAGVITSTLKLEEIKTIQKYRPEALVLKGGEEGKEDIFAISAGKQGSINQYGATFADATRDREGLATITLGIFFEGTNEELKEHLADKFGTALVHLGELEDKLPAVLREIGEKKEEMLAQIEVG